MIKRLLPESLKNKTKEKIKSKLSLTPLRTLHIANRVTKHGVPNYLNFSYEDLKNGVLDYTESLNTSGFEYKFSKSASSSVLYASIYACMLKGMLGELDKMSESDKRSWADYFDSFQSEDGYFRDPSLSGEEFENDGVWGDGWGIRHLASHAIIAYGRLGFTPKYKFEFLKRYYNKHFLGNWLGELFATKNMWSASNYIMNIVTLMQYSRDLMNDKDADQHINFILDWLEKKQVSQTGMWHNLPLNTEDDLHTSIRGAYHYFPLFIYENREIKYQDRIIENILKSQNSWGGFEKELHPSGACEDIDAIDPLIRFQLGTKLYKKEVDTAIKRALIWILSNKSEDGGFVFMSETPHEYGGHPLTSSLLGESNLMATWFRTLCLAYMIQYLDIENKFDIKRFPGYELPLNDEKK